MRILVIGSGAREHALAWKLAQSPRVSRVYAAPGNPGIAADAECVPIAVTHLAELADFAERSHIDLTVVGPEVPLVEGIADIFQERNLPIFGPAAAAAALEGSKAFAKEGAIVSLDMATAREAIREIMIERVFGAAGDVVVIEDYLEGVEIGATAICNGSRYLSLTLTQDHKRALDHDQGLNTGGMGAFTPLPFVDPLQEQQIHAQIIAPTLKTLETRGIHFSGVLYSNIMLTARGPVVLEHNTRFGDPETQALMLLLRADLLDVLSFTGEHEQLEQETLWHPGYAVSLTLASGGYPGKYRTGLPIVGIEEANRLQEVHVFHAGTTLQHGRLVTAGGRVLSAAAHGATLQEAVARVYDAAGRISFENMHYRRDIALQGLKVSY